MVFLDHEPGNEALRDFYSRDYFESGLDLRGYDSYERCEPFLTLNFRARAERLRSYAGGGAVLDVGCGYGYFLNTLGPSYERTGIELSEHAARVARQRFGLDVRTGLLEEAGFAPGRFALVTLWDVIEHVANPRATLETTRMVLADDGILALTTGNVDSIAAKVSGSRWHLFNVPEHLWFFSERTLRRLLAETGFEVLELRREWCRYSMDYLIERFLKTGLGARRRAPSTRLSFLARWWIPVNLFDIMYVVCRKN